MPERPVVISFDDGYRSHSTAAAPVLRTLGWPGVLNLEINNVGPGGISLGRLRGLVRDGWEIGSHTVHHPNLTTLGPVALRTELVRSRAWIHRRLGVDAAFFCYPAGRFDAAVVAAVRAAGYHGATTELPGPATAREDRTGCRGSARRGARAPTRCSPRSPRTALATAQAAHIPCPPREPDELPVETGAAAELSQLWPGARACCGPTSPSAFPACRPDDGLALSSSTCTYRASASC